MRRPFANIVDLFRTSLNSYGVTAFVNHPIPAMLIFLATWFHPPVGAMGLLGALVSNLTGRWLGVDRETWRSGVFGVSGLLVGLAVGMYTEPGSQAIITTIVGTVATGVLSVFLHAWMSKHDLPILSFPMILMIWPILISLGIHKINSVSYPAINWLRDLDMWLFDMLPLGMFEFLKSFGTILFQENLISGLIVLIAIGLWSRISLAYALWGGIVGMATYFYLHGSLDGFHGLNFVLTALAFGGFFIVANRNAFILTTLALLTVGLVDYAVVYFLNQPTSMTQASAPSAIFGHSVEKIPSLVFAFNIVTLIFLFPLKVIQFIQRKPRMIPVPLAQIRTPEANVRWAKRWLSKRYIQKTLITFPFMGDWTVLQGNDGEWTHKAAGQYAWDFVITDDAGKQYRNDGSAVADYYCYGVPVLSPASGTVVAIENQVEDNIPGNAVTERNWGNYIIIDHGNGEFSELSHFQQRSIKVVLDQQVKRGEILGFCGNSGRSPVPHIHFQLQDSAKPGGKTLPAVFSEGLINDELRVNFVPRQNDKLTPLKIEAEAEWSLLGRETESWTFKVSTGLQRLNETLHFTTDPFGLPAISTKSNYLWYILDKPSFVEIVPDFKTMPSLLTPSGWMKVVGDSLLLPKKLKVGFEWETGRVLFREGHVWTIESAGRIIRINTETSVIDQIALSNDAHFQMNLTSSTHDSVLLN